MFRKLCEKFYFFHALFLSYLFTHYYFLFLSTFLIIHNNIYCKLSPFFFIDMWKTNSFKNWMGIAESEANGLGGYFLPHLWSKQTTLYFSKKCGISWFLTIIISFSFLNVTLLRFQVQYSWLCDVTLDNFREKLFFLRVK